MIKKILLTIIFLSLLVAPVYADWQMNPFTHELDYYEPGANDTCSGTTTYLDGEGNCDDISGVYVQASDWTTIDNYPSACTGVNFVQGLGDNLSCSQPSNVTGNAATATALAANGANCSAGSAPLGVDASGAVESCTDYEEDLANSAGLAAALSDETGTGLAVFGTMPSIYTKMASATAGTLAVNTITLATAAGDYDLPDSCDSATGAWVCLYVRDAAEQVCLTVAGHTEDTIIYKGLALGAGDELDSPLAAQDSVCVVCLETNNWYVTSNSGSWTDGGADD